MTTMWPSVVQTEIESLEKELHECLDKDLPIDTVKLKRLFDLREMRFTELIQTHEQRIEIMKHKTRELTTKLMGLNLQAKPDLREKLLDEQDRYNSAASEWVSSGCCPWEESEAFSLAAGILVLACE